VHSPRRHSYPLRQAGSQAELGRSQSEAPLSCALLTAAAEITSAHDHTAPAIPFLRRRERFVCCLTFTTASPDRCSASCGARGWAPLGTDVFGIHNVAVALA
jgi:hypothetical protein